jgi:hypothetical protein
VLAYSLYPQHQVRSLAAVAAGFATGFSVDAWVSTAALAAFAVAYPLGMSFRHNAADLKPALAGAQ